MFLMLFVTVRLVSNKSVRCLYYGVGRDVSSFGLSVEIWGSGLHSGFDSVDLLFFFSSPPIAILRCGPLFVKAQSSWILRFRPVLTRFPGFRTVSLSAAGLSGFLVWCL